MSSDQSGLSLKTLPVVHQSGYDRLKPTWVRELIEQQATLVSTDATSTPESD